MESDSTAGELSQAKHDELVEGVGDGKPVVRNAAGAVDGPHASPVETSGSGSGVSDDGVSQLRLSSFDKSPVGAAEVEMRQEEKEISPGQTPPRRTEQAGPGSGSGSGSETEVVVEGRNGSSSKEDDSTVAMGDGPGS